MKKLIIAALLLFAGTSTAQDFGIRSIHLVGGPQFTNFIYTNSEDVKYKELSYQMYTSFGVNAVFKGNHHILRPEILFRQAGAKTSFYGTQLKWKMNYINLNIGYMYSVIDKSKFSLQPGVALSLGYMMNGRQEIGDKRLDIIKEESMKRFEIGAIGMLNGTFNITPFFSLGMEYRFGIGINQIENDITNQISRNIYHALLLNIGFSINNVNSPRI